MATWLNDIGERMRRHYEKYPYPQYNILGSIRAQDSYIFNLEALWAHFHGERLRGGPEERLLLAGSGSFLPYPVSVANPRGRVDALDLSARSLRRARLHALRHLRFNIDYIAGDLMDPAVAPGPYRYIDSFGVLHCIPDFAGALRALADRLVPGGILRVMVYSRDGRADVESVRALCAKRGIVTPREVRRLSREDESLRELLRESFELGSDQGVADAFLIPYARTFVVDELVEALSETPLELIRFCHQGALPDLESELRRIRELERRTAFPTNLAFYALKSPKGGAPSRDGGAAAAAAAGVASRSSARADTAGATGLSGAAAAAAAGANKAAAARATATLSSRPGRILTWLELNPLLRGVVRLPSPGSSYLPPKFGPENPDLDASARAFLRRFIRPRRSDSLSDEDLERTRPFLDRLILISYR